jgi:hypothetical protein
MDPAVFGVWLRGPSWSPLIRLPLAMIVAGIDSAMGQALPGDSATSPLLLHANTPLALAFATKTARQRA